VRNVSGRPQLSKSRQKPRRRSSSSHFEPPAREARKSCVTCLRVREVGLEGGEGETTHGGSEDAEHAHLTTKSGEDGCETRQ
jgi:hypothetical protein